MRWLTYLFFIHPCTYFSPSSTAVWGWKERGAEDPEGNNMEGGSRGRESLLVGYIIRKYLINIVTVQLD